MSRDQRSERPPRIRTIQAPRDERDRESWSEEDVHPRFRWRRSLVLIFLLGAAVHVLLPQLASLEGSLRILEGMRWWLVGLAVLAQALSYYGSGYLLQALVALTGERISVRVGMSVTLAANSVGLVAGGALGSAAASYRWTRDRGLSSQASLLAGWLPTLFNNLILAFFAVFGLAELLVLHQLSRPLLIGSSVVLALLTGVVLALFSALHFRQAWTRLLLRAERQRSRLLRRLADPDRARDAADRLFMAWDTLRNRGWKRPAIGAFLNTGFDLLTLFFLFAAAAHTVGPGVLMAGYGLPLLLGKFTFLPGGVGVIEATMTAMYTGLGVPATTAVLVVLAYRVLSFWIPTAIGFPLVFHYQRPTRPATHLPSP